MMDLNKFWKGKRVLITGGLGFIGSNLARRLVSLRAEVLLVDAMVPGFGGNMFNIQQIQKQVRVNFCDVRECYSMNYLVRDQDVIFNLAGSFNYLDAVEDPWRDLELTCRGALSLLEACRNNNPFAKVVFTGNRSQYGRIDSLPVREDQVRRPLQINAINNIAAEEYHILYNNVHEVKTTCLRLTNTYGPRHQMRHHKQGVVNWFIRLIIENREVPIFGDGRQVRDINYVDDVVEALLLAAMSEKANGQVYNLGGEPIALLDLVKIMIDLTGKGGYRFMEYPDQFRVFDSGDYVADYGKIKKDLGWKPKVSLRHGLAKTFEYYAKYKKHYWR